MMHKRLWFLALGLVLGACTALEPEQPQEEGLRLTTSVVPFECAEDTRTNLAGDAFAVGDWIKLKIICPFSDHYNEFGETTYSNTFDAFWLLKWNGSNWTPLTSNDKVDVTGSFEYTSSYSIFGVREAQQTPYVYTASTWNENVRFLSNGTYYSQYSYVFQADQSKEANYLKSDLLWAQTYMQTGSYNVHLSFQHVMACLQISFAGSVGLSADAVVTLEGMPDIDQCEVVVGDYYAKQSKVNLPHFSYKEKCECDLAHNGKVLGVAVLMDSPARAVVYPFTAEGDYIPNDAVYTAHRNGGTYHLIVPPCTLGTKPVIWVRDGETRYRYELDRLTFEQGKMYPVTITLE